MRKLVMSVLIVFLLIPWGKVWAQVTKLSVGYVGINSDNVIAFIAKESGIFAKNGLDVQLIYFGGGTTATMSLMAGETPITQTAGPGVVNAVLGGADAVMIAGGVTTLEGMKTILEPLKNDPKAKAAKPEDFVDMRFNKELDESGYIDRLYKGK